MQPLGVSTGGLIIGVQEQSFGRKWVSLDGDELVYDDWGSKCNHKFAHHYHDCRHNTHAILNGGNWVKVEGSSDESLICVKERSEGNCYHKSKIWLRIECAVKFQVYGNEDDGLNGIYVAQVDLQHILLRNWLFSLTCWTEKSITRGKKHQKSMQSTILSTELLIVDTGTFLMNRWLIKR